MPEIFTVHATEVKEGTKVNVPKGAPEAKKFEYLNHFASNGTYINMELGNMQTLVGKLNAKIKKARGIGKDIWGLSYEEAKLVGDHVQQDLNVIGGTFITELNKLNAEAMTRISGLPSRIENNPASYDTSKHELIKKYLITPLKAYIAKGGRLDKVIDVVDSKNADKEKVALALGNKRKEKQVTQKEIETDKSPRITSNRREHQRLMATNEDYRKKVLARRTK